MNFKIKGVDIEITEALRNYAEKKIYEALEKFDTEERKGSVLVEIELSKTNNHHTHGEMYKSSAKVSGIYKNIFMEATKDDLYASIDELKDKLDHRLAEHKDKKKTLTHRMALRFKKLFKNQD
ncbi:MAG: Sigma 54 modulation protein / ribosomal protein [Candidatus Parcubacteria bacterium]|jgi:putative sigma-54 modulation protein